MKKGSLGDSMAEDAFDKYLSEINTAYLRGDALMEYLAVKLTGSIIGGYR